MASLLITLDHAIAEGLSVATLVIHDKTVQDIKVDFALYDTVMILDILSTCRNQSYLFRTIQLPYNRFFQSHPQFV